MKTLLLLSKVIGDLALTFRRVLELELHPIHQHRLKREGHVGVHMCRFGYSRVQ